MWLGLVISLIGDHLYRVGLTWSISDRGGILDAASLGVAIALPAAVFAIVGGVIADRTRPIDVMIAADVGRAIMSAALVVIALHDTPALPAYLVSAALLSIGSAMFVPAQQAVLPQLAGGNRDLIIHINAWFIGTLNIMRVLGPLIAGFAVGFLPIAMLFAADSLSYVFSAVMLVFVRRTLSCQGSDPHRAAMVASRGLGPFLDGFRFLMRQRLLRPMILTFAIADTGFFALPFVLPAFVQEAQNSSGSYGSMLGAIALGRVMGTWLFARLVFLNRRRGAILALNFLLQGGAILAFALVHRHSPIAGMLLLFVSGLPAGAAQVAFASYVQIEVPSEQRGRVFASMMALTTAFPPLALPAFGALGAHHGPLSCILVIAALYMLGGLILSRHRSIWRIA